MIASSTRGFTTPRAATPTVINPYPGPPDQDEKGSVGVDLEQDRDAVPGAAGDLGGGDAGVEPEGHGGVAEVVGAAGEGGGVLGRGERGGAAACQTAL